MRSIWKGAIAFGLVTIPVKLYSATEERDITFHQVRRSDGSRIRYKRVAAADGEEVAYADIAKGFELPSGETVVLTDEDLADLPLSSSRSMEVHSFVPLEQVDPIYFAKTYFLEPDKGGLKPYVLLRDALQASGRVALVKVALRQRESLAALRVRDGVFVLETMLWPDEIRTAEFAALDEAVEVRPQELAMARSLIDSLATDFHPEDFSDDYRAALEAVVDAKIAGHQVVSPPTPAGDQGGGSVVDLLAALRASVEAARGARGEAAPDAAPAAAEPDDPADGAAPATRRRSAARPTGGGRTRTSRAATSAPAASGQPDADEPVKAARSRRRTA